MENILSVNLETTTAPQVVETRGKDYIEYGTEDWKNLYPQFLIDLYYNSSTQAAIINATAEMISAEDIIIEDEENADLKRLVKLKQFMAECNSHETLHEVIKKVAFDFKLQGAFALNIVWSADRTEIAEIYHIPVEKVRAEKPDEMGKVCNYYVCSDWRNTRQNKPYKVPAFNKHDRTSANQILYSGLYSPDMNVYHTPDYLAANNWALIDQNVAEFHLNNIQNGFSGSYFISFANGVPTQEERLQIERSLADKFTGAHNSGKFVLTFSDDKTRTPEINPISMADADKQYLALQELLVQNILTGHRVTSPMLMGIKSDTGLGNNADELNTAANFYLNTVIKPFQDHIIKILNKLFYCNNMDMPLSFVQLKPITTRFTNQDLAAVMTQDEIREELGLPPLDEDVVVKEDMTKMSDFSTLETYLETLEDIPENWEIINTEIVDGEHRDFDYEKELNDIANNKLELVSTGRANPNARSKQDGLNKRKTAFYKVRYVYARDESLTNQSGTRREFCQKMMTAGKIYRKEDIIKMGKMAVNPGFGPKGAKNYDIFLYKGGPQCFHYWERRIYKAPKNEDNYVYYPDPIQDDVIIKATTARSQGFTAERNDELVAIAPRNMKNNGYLEPRN